MPHHGRVAQRLAELDINLEATRTSPVASYEATKLHGSVLYVAGHGPFLNGIPQVVGKVPSVVTVQNAVVAARLAALNCVSSIEAALGDLDRVSSILRMFGMVNADTDFVDHATVINGASELLFELFGDSGHHTRAAVGMASLPFGISVELEMIVSVV